MTCHNMTLLSLWTLFDSFPVLLYNGICRLKYHKTVQEQIMSVYLYLRQHECSLDQDLCDLVHVPIKVGKKKVPIPTSQVIEMYLNMVKD